jgi:hypothetical protein
MVHAGPVGAAARRVSTAIASPATLLEVLDEGSGGYPGIELAALAAVVLGGRWPTSSRPSGSLHHTGGVILTPRGR